MREDRIRLKLSQTRLAFRSGVRRQRICYAEAGDLVLRPDELTRIHDVLLSEAQRLRGLAVTWAPDQGGTQAAA
jgi:hypothetical protein